MKGVKKAKKAEKAKLRQRTFVMVGIVVIACGLLIAILSGSLMRDWITISYGVRMRSKIQYFGIGVATSGLFWSLVNCVPLIRIAIEKQAQKEQELRSEQNWSQVMTNYRKDSANPEFTRQRLEQLCEEMPRLEHLVGRCLEQMDTMDRLQAKQGSLIETNEADYLRNTVDVLDNVERRICQNFRNVVNLCIAAESDDSVDEVVVEKYLNDNQKKLNNTKELLKASAEWINQYNAGENSNNSEVENWIAVIRESLREE